MTNKIPKQSPDIQAERLEKLKNLFPDLFDHEGNLDEKELKALTQNYSVPQVEKFTFDWAGKRSSKKVAFKPSKATLKLDKEKSINLDNTDNLIIEGDNLEVLKLLRASYFEQVKCIYIDPPYNTGNDFIYPDNFTEDKKAYWEKNGQVKDGVKLDTNGESKGRYHSDWLNMMQSRLLLSRNLLREDGVIFVSIDDNEVHNLRKLMDEVFGEENFVAQIVWKKRGGGGSDNKYFSTEYEYIICYLKDCNQVTQFKIDYSEKEKERFNLEDKDGKYYLKTLIRPERLGSRPNLQYAIIDPDNNKIEYKKDGKKLTWVVGKDTFEKMKKNDEIVFQKNREGGWGVYRKVYMKNRVPSSLFTEIAFNRDATTEIKKIFPNSIDIFSNPKPSKLIQHLLKIAQANENDLILDFFAGSGTTAQAVMELNKEDGGNRKFILVQIPEYTDEKSEAYKAGYKTIADICIERVKRSGEKIKEESQKNLPGFQNLAGLDLGFKVFKLTHSHFTENLYAPDPEKSEEENIKAFDEYMKGVQQSFMFDFEFEGLLYEIALKDGFNLNFTYEEIMTTDGLSRLFTKNKVYLIKDKRGKEALICLDEDLDEATVKKMIKYNKDKRFIYLARAIDTTKKWTLRNKLGESLLWEV